MQPETPHYNHWLSGSCLSTSGFWRPGYHFFLWRGESNTAGFGWQNTPSLGHIHFFERPHLRAGFVNLKGTSSSRCHSELQGQACVSLREAWGSRFCTVLHHYLERHCSRSQETADVSPLEDFPSAAHSGALVHNWVLISRPCLYLLHLFAPNSLVSMCISALLPFLPASVSFSLCELTLTPTPSSPFSLLPSLFSFSSSLLRQV